MQSVPNENAKEEKVAKYVLGKYSEEIMLLATVFIKLSAQRASKKQEKVNRLLMV